MIDDPTPPDLQTIKKAASCLGLSYRELLKAANDGRLPIYRIGSSYRRVSLTEVKECIRISTTEARHAN